MGRTARRSLASVVEMVGAGMLKGGYFAIHDRLWGRMRRCRTAGLASPAVSTFFSR